MLDRYKKLRKILLAKIEELQVYSSQRGNGRVEKSLEALHTTGKAIIGWLQACQNSDGGFGFLPGTTSFIENSHWSLRSLALLGSAPLSPDMARDFVLRCKTRGGGFARKSGGAPFLHSTWHAVAGLALLSKMSQIRRAGKEKP